MASDPLEELNYIEDSLTQLDDFINDVCEILSVEETVDKAFLRQQAYWITQRLLETEKDLPSTCLQKLA
jgi:hypothetical protein